MYNNQVQETSFECQCHFNRYLTREIKFSDGNMEATEIDVGKGCSNFSSITNFVITHLHCDFVILAFLNQVEVTTSQIVMKLDSHGFAISNTDSCCHQRLEDVGLSYGQIRDVLLGE